MGKLNLSALRSNTVIDEFCLQNLRDFKAALKAAKKLATGDDRQKAKRTIKMMQEAPLLDQVRYVMEPREEGLTSSHLPTFGHELAKHLTTFFFDAPVMTTLLCPTAEVLRSFVGHAIPKDVSQEAHERFPEVQVWSVDLPKDSGFELDGRPIRNIIDDTASGSICILVEEDSRLVPEVILQHENNIITTPGLTPSAIELVTNLVEALVALYAATVETEDDAADWVAERRVAAEDPVQKSTEGRKVLALFRSVNLRRSENSSRQRSSGSRSSWSLDHKIKVRGHFRWISRADGTSGRRPVWVSEHTRGSGALINKPAAVQL